MPHDISIETVQRLFTAKGFVASSNSDLEPNVEKLALFAIEAEFTHVARQLPDGAWTSKLGEDCDIEHELQALMTPPSSFALWRYGRITTYMRRRR